jgi:hypothetical protein
MALLLQYLKGWRIQTFGERDEDCAWFQTLRELRHAPHEIIVEARRVREHNVAVEPVELQDRTLSISSVCNNNKVRDNK